MAVKCSIIKIHLDGKSQNANDTNWFAVRFQCFWDIKTVESKMKLFESNGGFMEPSLLPYTCIISEYGYSFMINIIAFLGTGQEILAYTVNVSVYHASKSS